MRVLHVAALPFPSHQGTQAAIGGMLTAATHAGREVELLTYGGGHDCEPLAFTHHGIPDIESLSLRSGPSLRKLQLDARMHLALRERLRTRAPNVLIAHHVEAAALVLTQRVRHWVFFAHTDLATELPTYAPSAAAPWLAHAGGRLDRTLLRSAPAVAAISPALLDALRRHAPMLGDKSLYVPLPWSVPAPISTEERARGRQRLGLSDSAEVLLYAGNLDAYQGLDTLLHAVARIAARRPTVRLLVATESDGDALRRRAQGVGVAERLQFTGLRGEVARRAAHAAADVALVPRLAPGGLPIKLLDALARGVPCVATQRACAGLALTNVVARPPDDSSEHLARAVEEVLAAPERRMSLAQAGPTYIRRSHTPELHFEALDTLLAQALSVR